MNNLLIQGGRSTIADRDYGEKDGLHFLAKRFLFLVQNCLVAYCLVAYCLVAYVVLLRRVCFCPGGFAAVELRMSSEFGSGKARMSSELAAEKYRPTLSQRGSGQKVTPRQLHCFQSSSSSHRKPRPGMLFRILKKTSCHREYMAGKRERNTVHGSGFPTAIAEEPS